MQTTINHTGRRKIERSELQVFLNEQQSGPPSFDVNFSLDTNNLNSEAAIYIEAYQGNTLQRFVFGTVGQIEKPDNRILNQLSLSKPTLFRIHIVDETGDHGKLIASGQFKPEADDAAEQRASLLTVHARPLGQQTWNIEFETSGKPELCINSSIPDAIGQIRNNPHFQALILPSALRQVLMYFLWDDDLDDNDIANDWIRFGEQLAYELPSGKDTILLINWIDEVVLRFSESFRLCDMLTNNLKGQDL